MLAAVDPLVFFQPAPYLPTGVKPREFLGCSALPALFGHCWAPEFRHGYIKFLTTIAKKLPESAFVNFREHWLFECFKNYIHASNIHHFLQLSIGDVLIRIVRDGPAPLNKLVEWVKEMVARMLTNLPTFPNDVRLLLRKFGALREDPAKRLAQIEILFLDCIAAPAISTPKAYCILPQTFQLDMSPDGPARSLQMLAQLFRFIRHAKQAQMRYPDLDTAQLEKIPLAAFLQELTGINLKIEDLGEPTLRDVMRCGNWGQATMLFTIPDICLLARVLPHDVFPEARLIPVDQKVDFEFFRVPISVSALKLTTRGSASHELLQPSSAVGVAARGLYTFLTRVKEDRGAPDDLAQFLRYHESTARKRVDFGRYLYLNHLTLRLSTLKDSDLADIFPALETEIQKQRELVDRNGLLLTKIARLTIQLEAEVTAYQRKADQSFAILYSCLLSGFLDSDSSVAATFAQRRGEFLTDKRAFMDFFVTCLGKLKAYLSQFAEHTFPKVAAHFHTWIMQRIPLQEFTNTHPDFPRKDDALSTVSKDIIAGVCIDPAPEKLKTIFVNPPLFQFCQIELLNAEMVELPLEAILRIASAVNLVQKMFELAYGVAPQADEMTPLFNYALLTSGLSKMFSLQKYLEHFLRDIPSQDVHFLDEGKSIALTHFINHVSSLDEIMTSGLG
jgi:hypothetical protein